MTKQFTQSRVFSFIIAGTGIAMMYYGIHRGEMAVVLAKAINICMECIGIG